MARILIVDDDPDVRDMLADIVETLGHEAYRADAGVAGLVLIDAARPDLVILDLSMPELSGGQVLDHVCQQHPEVPVLVLTGHLDPDIEDDMRRRGAVDYLIKPVEMEQLGRRIQAALTGRTVD